MKQPGFRTLTLVAAAAWVAAWRSQDTPGDNGDTVVDESTSGDGTYTARHNLTADGAINIVDALDAMPVFNTSYI